MDIREKVLQSTQITEFQRKVYLELLNVPAGETITYGELARRIGCRSPRAVGGALHRNPFAPDVPCHRVISSDGSIGGYAFGPEKKMELLNREAHHSPNHQDSLSKYHGLAKPKTSKTADPKVSEVQPEGAE